MSDLEAYFRNNPGRLIHKCAHYFDIYEQYFAKYRGKDVLILEIGVYHGVSLQMWKNYFGDKAKIYGIDINPECKKFEEEGIKIFIGSQADGHFLREVILQLPPIDILIDDGGHTMHQQITAFKEMFKHVKADGIYICEDLHTSYWLKYGGGYKRKGTFIEYSKNIIDQLNAYYSEQNALKVDTLTKSIKGLHYYNGILVVEKGEVSNFQIEKIGTPAPISEDVKAKLPRLLYIPAYAIVYSLNSILRFFRLPGIIWK